MQLGSLDIDLAARKVFRNGQRIVLTAREWILLETFLKIPDRLLSKDLLWERLYSFESQVESNTIEVLVSRLRKKLGHSIIQTERGLGYRLDTT